MYFILDSSALQRILGAELSGCPPYQDLLYEQEVVKAVFEDTDIIFSSKSILTEMQSTMAGMIQVLRQIVAPGDSCPRDAFLSKQHASPLLDSIAVSHTVPMHDPSTQYQDQYGDETHLLSSPYTDQQHLLDVTTLDHTEHIELAKALQHLVRVRDDYATAEYATSFNWPEVVDQLRASLDASAQTFKRTKFYVIVFRSRLPLDTDRAHLGRLDAASHLEATQSGGLLKYWFGIPDSKGANLATCIWRYRQDARKGGAGPVSGP